MNTTVGFNPFPVSTLDAIEPEHLALLLEVEEGWYIDYKEEPLRPRDLAKHLSSFANQYGGWLVFGAREARNDKGEKLGHPDCFPGLTQTQVVTLKSDLESAARQCVDPTPLFDTKELKGPINELGLPSGHSVVIVLIPAGRHTPYIHNSGRIYRRVGAQSDPVEIKDRGSLQELIERAAEHRIKLRHFLKERPIVSKYEQNVVYLHLYAIPVPLGHPLKTTSLSFEDFVQLARAQSKSDNGRAVSFAYEHTYTTQDGYLARHVANNDPYLRLTTWRYYQDFSSIFTFPVNTLSLKKDQFAHFKHWNEFVDICNQAGLQSGDALDLTMVFAWITDASIKIRETLDLEGLAQATYFKLVLENAWRKLPFIDSEQYIEHVRTFGLPLIQDLELFAPPGLETLGYIPEQSLTSDESSGWHVAVEPFVKLLQMVGIPLEMTSANDNEFWVELFDAMDRIVAPVVGSLK